MVVLISLALYRAKNISPGTISFGKFFWCFMGIATEWDMKREKFLNDLGKLVRGYGSCFTNFCGIFVLWLFIHMKFFIDKDDFYHQAAKKQIGMIGKERYFELREEGFTDVDLKYFQERSNSKFSKSTDTNNPNSKQMLCGVEPNLISNLKQKLKKRQKELQKEFPQEEQKLSLQDTSFDAAYNRQDPLQDLSDNTIFSLNQDHSRKPPPLTK